MTTPSEIQNPKSKIQDPQGLLCFGGFARHDWGLLWQRQQAVMTRLAAQFEVYYIERFGTRRLGPGAMLRALARRYLRPRRPTGGEPAGDLRFIDPRVAPFHASRLWRRRNFAALERAVEDAWPRDLRRRILWIYNPSYLALEYLERHAGRWDRTVYDCVQRFAFNRYYPRDIGEIDRAIARCVDLVLTDSQTIHNEKKPLNPNTHFIPQGVDLERFAWQGVNRTPPDDLRWMSHPVLFYHGAWHQAFDESLVVAALDAIAGSTFIFVGPTLGREKNLLRRCGPRAACFGPVDHQRLGRYVNACDVLVIPYRMDEHTRGVFPTKFFEYVATGLPIVATDLPDLRRYGDWAALARNRDEFVEACRAAASQPRRPPEVVLPFLEPHTWDRRVERMLELLAID